METSTKLAYDRTYLAHERTQMAWVRTSLSLISFGFTIAKFYKFLQDSQQVETSFFSPKWVGMSMILVGLVSLVLASVQHRQAMVAMRQDYPDLPSSTAGLVSVFILILGIGASVATI